MTILISLILSLVFHGPKLEEPPAPPLPFFTEK